MMDGQCRVMCHDVCHQLDLVRTCSSIKSRNLKSYASDPFRHPRATDVTEHDTLAERIAYTLIAATT